MSAKNFSCQLFVLVLVCVPSVAMAQAGSGDSGWPPSFYQPVPTLPPHLGESYHHDSTALGNALRGSASVIHAQGNYLLNMSQAAILAELARSLDISNRGKWIGFRVANRARRAAERQHSIDVQRAKNEAAHSNKFAAAYRLDSNQLDRTNGKIAWPEVLLVAKYADVRSQLDEMFRRNATFAGSQSERSFEIKRYVERLRSAVGRDIGQLSRGDYTAAQKFLCGLKYEAEFEAMGWGESQLASRLPK